MTRFELSKREKDVVILKIAGFGDKEIANKLSMAYGTVRTHIQNAKIKLRCNSTFQLVAKASEKLKIDFAE